MQSYILAGVIVVIVLLYIARMMPPREQVERPVDKVGVLPYTRKKYILTPTEFHFYKALRAATDDRYLIVPQVHLEGLVEVAKGERYWRTYFNKTIKKSVDFVLFDRDTVVALLAIELDDYSHHYEQRKERDDFVNQLFTQVGLKLLRIPTQQNYDSAHLRAQLDKLITLR